MRRKYIVLILVALTLSCLSGCHKDKPEPTEPAPLETITPETQPETISDKLDETDTYKIETAPAPKAIGIDENGEKIKDTTPETSPSDVETEKETLTAEEESQRAIEESENQQKLEEIQESVSESIAASDETLSASDYQAINDAIDEYNKKEVEEWSSKVDWSQFK